MLTLNFDQRTNSKNVSLGGIKQVESPYVATPHHNRAGVVDVGLKQHDIARNANKSSLRKLYLIDEPTYRNYSQQVDVDETTQNRSPMEQDVTSRFQNTDVGENIKSFLIGIFDSWVRHY